MLLLLVSPLACDAHRVSQCCSLLPPPPQRSCRLYVLLCRHGSQAAAPGGSDAAAGILTLGKRGPPGEEQRLQSRLQQLLHGSRNQAAGILTVGRRTAEQQRLARRRRSDASSSTPLP